VLILQCDKSIKKEKQSSLWYCE